MKKHIALTPVDCTQANSSIAIYEHLADFGFVILDKHSLDVGLMNECHRLWKAFFERGEKQQFMLRDGHKDGLVSFMESSKNSCRVGIGGDQVDPISFYNFYPWGVCPSYLKLMSTMAYWHMVHLAIKLLSGLEACIPSHLQSQLSESFADMLEDSRETLLRPMYSHALSERQRRHTKPIEDFANPGLLTLIPGCGRQGLQFSGRGSNWYTIPSDPRYLFVGVGEVLQEQTQRHFVATRARFKDGVAEMGAQDSLTMLLQVCPREDNAVAENECPLTEEVAQNSVVA